MLDIPTSKPVARNRAMRAAKGNAKTKVLCALAMAALILSPFFIYPVFLMKILCFAMFAMAFNLLLGYGGLLSFGHAAFFGLASYVCAFLLKEWQINTEVSIIAGALVAAIVGAVVGLIAIRRQGIYFAMITLALAQMVYFFAVQAPDLTGGEDGIQSVPRGELLGVLNLSNDYVLYGVVATIFVLCFALIYRIVNSPFGEVCKAIRENETRATSLGYDIDRYKLLMFTLSAGIAGLAGATKAVVFQLASLTDIHWSMSGEVVLMTLIGGVGTLVGPVIGSAVIVSIQNYLAELGAWVTIVQGVIFVACVILFREGIYSLFKGKNGV